MERFRRRYRNHRLAWKLSVGATEPSDKKIAHNIEKLSVCLLQAVGRVEELVCDHPKLPEIIRATTIRKRDFVVAIENVGTDHIYGIERTTSPGAYRRDKSEIGRILLFLVVGAFQGEEPDGSKKVAE